MNILRKIAVVVMVAMFAGVSFPAFAHDGWYNRDNSYRVYHHNFYNRHSYYGRYHSGYYGRYRYRNFGRNLAAGIVLGAIVGTLFQNNYSSPWHVYTQQQPMYIQRQPEYQPQRNCQQRRIWDRYLQREITKTTCYSR